MRHARKSFRPRIFHDLTRDEGASTLIRLNNSQHVADLRLIFHVTVLLMIVGIVLAIATHQWLGDSNLLPASAMVAAIGAGGCGVLVWTYQSGSARLGIVDLFSCEIATICRVVTIVGVASRYVDAHGHPPARPSAFTSTEDYTPIFDNNSKDLELLEARTVEPVTAFYTYLKAMRDSMRLLSTIEHPDRQTEPWQHGVRSVVYMLFLMLESGREAIGRLIEFDPERVQNTITILLSELVAYKFLVELAAPDKEQRAYDAHAARLDLRRADYLVRVPEMYFAALANRDDPEWAKAVALTGELNERFRDLFGRAIDGEEPAAAEPATPPPAARISAPAC
jgi:hypothetical protein